MVYRHNASARLVLYKRKGCPYCREVLRFIKKKGLDKVEIVDADSDPKHEDYLVRNAGENSVPCLFVDGKPIFDSDKIIARLGG
jgi:glutaredoxin 3